MCLNRTSDDRIYWKCVIKGCKSTAITWYGEYNEIEGKIGKAVHQHLPDPEGYKV